MERNLYDDEFEDFLKEKVDEYKIYPSEKVWGGIYTFLHKGRKWYTLAGTLLLLTTMALISLEIVFSGYNNAAYNIVTDSVITSSSSNAVNSTHNTLATSAHKNTFPPLLIAGSFFEPLFLNFKRDLRLYSTRSRKASAEKDDFNTPLVYSPLYKSSPSVFLNTTIHFIPAASQHADIVDEKTAIPPKESEPKKEGVINWLQEMAAIRLMRKEQNRFNLQFYFSPTASYRRLKNYKDPAGNINKKIPMSDNPVDVESIVDHRPALGLEIGSALLFNASENLILKTGLQLNYVHYNIKAYRSAPERTDITLSSLTHSGRTETITTYSSIRNLNGRYQENLQNEYLQLSIPIGAELKLAGNKRLQLNVAGTVQPSYLLLNNTYMLSSNYGNYTKEPALVRKWNVNAAVETYISYSMGGLRWQLGPQFRYQLLSTYTDRYPVREYLMEYGVKIGVSKTLK